MAILQNPANGRKLLIRRNDPRYKIILADGWKDVTPPLSEKQRAHQIYWRDMGQLSNFINTLNHVSDNSLLDNLAKREIRDLLMSARMCLSIAKAKKAQEKKYVKPKATNNG